MAKSPEDKKIDSLETFVKRIDSFDTAVLYKLMWCMMEVKDMSKQELLVIDVLN
jgi:hypothetical protein